MPTIFESNVDELSDPIFDALINETNNLINYEDEEISNPIEINSFEDYFEIFEFVVDNYHNTESFLFEQVFFESSIFIENNSLVLYNPTNYDVGNVRQTNTYDPSSSSSSNKQDKQRNLSLLGTAREKVKNFFGRIKNKVSNTKLGRRIFNGKFKTAVHSKVFSNSMNGKSKDTMADIHKMVAKYYKLDPISDHDKIRKLANKHGNPKTFSGQRRIGRGMIALGTLSGLRSHAMQKNKDEAEKLWESNYENEESLIL